MNGRFDQNPWVDLPTKPPYVLPRDLRILERHPRVLEHLRLDCPPCPWVGRPLEAKVLLLTLNPGYVPGDSEHDVQLPGYIEENRASLFFESTVPAWCFNQRLRTTGAYAYWNRRLRELIEAVGMQAVAEGVGWLEYFPYHSADYRSLSETLPSQRFTFGLLDQALRDGKLIVVLRAFSLWAAKVRQLGSYPGLIKAKSQRAATVSRGNLGDEAFMSVARRLRT